VLPKKSKITKTLLKTKSQKVGHSLGSRAQTLGPVFNFQYCREGRERTFSEIVEFLLRI
jgi:hypothetical protein